MDSAFIYRAANELVQNAGTRNIKQIARSCSLDISETSRIKDMLGLLSLYFDKPLILINRQLDKQTKQMVCGYALGHYLEHQLLMDLHTLNKFLTIKDKHILLYEHNAFTSHLMLDSDEVYQMTKRGLDAEGNLFVLFPAHDAEKNQGTKRQGTQYNRTAYPACLEATERGNGGVVP